MLIVRSSWFLAFVVFFCTHLAIAKQELQLLTTNSPLQTASLLSAHSGTEYQFSINAEPNRLSNHHLVRWGHPTIALGSSEIILTGGTRLVLAKSWTGQTEYQYDAEKILVTTKTFGKLTIPRNQVRAILFDTPKEGYRKAKFINKILQLSNVQDQLLLASGEVIACQLPPSFSTNQEIRINSFTVNVDNTTRTISNKDLAAVLFANPSELESPKLAVGFSDGSICFAEQFEAKSTGFSIVLNNNLHLTGGSLEEIVWLQNLEYVSYVSDLNPLEYRHTPYLNIGWQYACNNNLFGDMLQAASNTYTKGLAMHADSQLIYKIPSQESLPQSRPQYFAAEIALDKSSQGRGSVLFSVHLLRGNNWQRVFTSQVIRGNDNPQSVRVELNNAQQIMLQVEHADRGDELDHANWLDARFE